MKKFTTATTDIKKRRILRVVPVLAAAGILSVVLTGCGSSDEEVQRYSWPLATASPEDTVTQIFAEKFAEEVSDLSDGKMKIQVYANSTLGGDRDLLETCSDGDIPFVVQNTAPQVSFMSDLAVFDLPCVFDSLDDCRKKIDDPEFYSLISDVYTNGGYHLAFWKALGANPTPMSFSEVYIGLQQHTIDAQENPYEVIVSNNLYEQQDYVVETNHLPHLISLIVNDEFFKDLPEDEQEIMTEAAQLATEYAREQSDARIADKIATIEESGTEIITLSDKTRKEIREASKDVYESIREVIDPKIYDSYMERIEK